MNPNGANTGSSELATRFANQRYAWQPYNSVENFFRTGNVINTSLNIRGNSEDGKVAFNVNYGHLDEKGFTPGNSINRNTLAVGGRAQLTNKFTASATLNFSRNNVKSPPVAASRGNGTLGFSTYANVFFTPRSVDLIGLPFEIPENQGSIYYRDGNDIINPRWTVKNAGSTQLTNRVFGTASLQYDFNDNLNVLYRAGIDFYNERNSQFSNKNGVNFNQAINGRLVTWDNNVRIWDHYASISGDYNLTDDFGVGFTVGGTSRSRRFERDGLRSDGQIVFGILRHWNFTTPSPTFADGRNIQFTDRRNIIGLFGEVLVDFRNQVFITFSARNDWVSNLPTENNNKFYPSISGSWIPTQTFPDIKSNGWGLNYLKIRAGLGQSAGFPNWIPSITNSKLRNSG